VEDRTGTSPGTLPGLEATSKTCRPADAATAKQTTETQTTQSSFILGLLRLAGVEYWMVAWTPTWVGWVIATKLAIPDLAAFLLFVVVGPLLTGSTFLLNNLVDRVADQGNPRKSFSLLVQRRIGTRTVTFLYILLVGAALALAGATGHLIAQRRSWEPLLLVGAFVTLSMAYSYPTTGLKHHGGADLVTNAMGFGLIMPLVGWSLAEPMVEFPLLYLAAIVLTLGALYAPTTVADFAADRVVATHSLAVRFGIPRALKLGFVLLVAGDLCLVASGLFELYPWTHELLLATGWFLPLQVLVYHRFFWPGGDSIPHYDHIWQGCVALGSLCAISNLAFMAFFLAWG